MCTLRYNIQDFHNSSATATPPFFLKEIETPFLRMSLVVSFITIIFLILAHAVICRRMRLAGGLVWTLWPNVSFLEIIHRIFVSFGSNISISKQRQNTFFHYMKFYNDKSSFWNERKSWEIVYLYFNNKLEDTARYAGLLLAPAEGFSLQPRLFLAFGQKRPILLFWPILGNFWCQVVTLVTFCSNLTSFKQKKRSKIIQKSSKITISKKIQKIQKNKKTK